MAKIISASKITDQIFDLHKTGNKPGVKIGFSNVDDLYSVKMGVTTIIYGHPTSGKTQILHEFIKSLSCVHGMRGLMYSPETGNAAEIYAELIHCITGMSFDKRSQYGYISEKELYTVIPFISDYLKIIEPESEKGLSLDEFSELTKEAKKDYNISWTSIDNWNDLDHNIKSAGGMISEYLKMQLPKWNRLASMLNIHNFMVCHARNPTLANGDRFPTMPRPDEIEGGSVWYAKAMNLIGVHRNYVDTEDGVKQSNEAQIDIKKVKPKIVGKKGTCYLKFDWYQNRYYNENQYIETPFITNQPAEKREEIKQLKAPF